MLGRILGTIILCADSRLCNTAFHLKNLQKLYTKKQTAMRFSTWFVCFSYKVKFNTVMVCFN